MNNQAHNKVLLLLLWCSALAAFPPQPATAPPVVSSVVAPAGNTPVNGIVQWTLNLTNVTTNPWEAVNITLALKQPSGARPLHAPIKGYHQGGDEWRVRAVLQTPGVYEYSLVVAWFNASSSATLALHSTSGTVTCDAGAPAQPTSVGPRGFLRPRFDSPPFRTAFEDGTLFAGFGLGDCLNEDLNFLTFNETDKTTFNRTLAQYLGDYGDAGFQMFRWSDGNCAFSITKALDGNPLGRHGWRDQGNAYDERYCALVDELFDALRAHGFTIWAVLFQKGNSRPPVFPNMNESDTSYHVAQRQAIARHLDFAVARWGAQVDVWSLLNEQRADANWYAYAAGYLAGADPYQHPVSSSWDDHANMTQLQIDSVHWYYSKGTGNSDAAVKELAEQHLAFGKPVYITESGNQGHNWDPDSHTRMRIRSWSAFFQGVSLLWWNTAGTQSCSPCGGGNMYLGPLERSYQRVLRSFTDGMRDPAVQAANVSTAPASPFAVRAFGLAGAGSGANAGKRVLMAYVHHTDHASFTQANVTFSMPPPSVVAPGGCSGFWVDAQRGNTTAATAATAAGSDGASLALTTPLFAIDIGLMLVC